MTQTITRWGDQTLNVHVFHDTPFGTVQLNNFQKTGPDTFAIWMTVHNDYVTYEGMSVTWWNCHADDAYTSFGIERSEQSMWGE
jgi:hypothetical protein